MTSTFITNFPSMSKLRLRIFICVIFVQQVGLFLLYAQEHTESNSTIGVPSSSEETSTPSTTPIPQPSITHKNLIISEVFFKGSNEFIEIANISDLDYQGEITLKQEGRKPQKTTIDIPAYQTKLFARESSQWDYPLGFALTDTAAINLSLSDDNGLLDHFEVDEIQVKKLNKSKIPTSFEKIYQNGNRIILPTTEGRAKNSPEGIIANPKYFSKEDQNSDWNQSLHDESWDIHNPESDSSLLHDNNQRENQITPPNNQLILTEAFFNKDNNRVEISNISDQDFEGEVSIDGFIGNKKATTHLNIPAQSSIILAKNTKYLDENLNIQVYKNFPTIDWKHDLNLVLTYKDKSDILNAHLDRVKKIKGADQSFEKILINGKRITTRNMERQENIRGSIRANPGKYFTEWENIKDISQPINQPQSDNTQPNNPKCEQINDPYMINMKEFFAGNSSYPAFVEIEFVDDPKDFSQIKLSWPLFNQEVIFDKNEDFWEKGKRVVLSSSNQRSEKGIDSLFSEKFQLNYQWWEAILQWWDGQDRQVLDIAQLPAIDAGKSFYQNKNNANNCTKSFDKIGDFSPWFDRKFLEYFKIESTPRIEYIYVNKWGGGWGSLSCPTKADLCPPPEVTSKKNKQEEKSDSNLEKTTREDNTESIQHLDQDTTESKIGTDKSQEKNYQVKIEDLVYDPPGADSKKESITLLLTKGDQLDLKKTTLNIDGKNKKINGILNYGESKTLVGSFGFPNKKKDKSNIVIQLKLGNQILDTFVYTIAEKNIIGKEKKQENKKEGIKVFSVLDGDTFRYKDENGKLQSVRLIWVDSPESNTARYRNTECYGKESKQALTNLIKGKTVKLEFDQNQSSSDNYGRQLAYVRLDDLLVNQHLIAEGYAKEYTFKTAYSKQHEFQSAQSQAKEKKIWLWSPVHCPNNLENEEDSQENSKNLVIKITDIDYDPKGTDRDKESITLSLFNKNKELSHIDFSKQWGILVFDWTENYQQLNLEEIESNKWRFIDLSSFGKQEINNPLILKGQFNLPNTKSSCIALFQKDHLYDIACYQVKDKEKTLKPIENLYNTGAIKITSILPNPKGKDKGKEFIEFKSHIEQDIELSNWFLLLINGKTKKKISGYLLAWEKKKIYGNFSFSNDHSCVSIVHQNQILDTFCYEKEKEGAIITKDNTILSQQSTEDLVILKKVKFVKKWNQWCISYQDTLLKCRNIPRSKTDPLLKAESSMYRKAFKLFEEMIRKNYTPIYYQSDLKSLFDLIKEGKNDLKQKKTKSLIYGERYDRSDFDKVFEAKYEQQIWKQGIYFLKKLLNLEEKQA